MKDNKYEKIWAAADQLVLDGVEKPTNEDVRNRLGGGSLATISPAMKEWRGQRASDHPAQLEIPTSLENENQRFISSIWKAASKEANLRYKANEIEYQEIIKTAEIERDEALTEVAKLELQLENTNKELSNKTKDLATLSKSLESLRTTYNDLKVENATHTAQATATDTLLVATRKELQDAKQNSNRLQTKLFELIEKNGH